MSRRLLAASVALALTASSIAAPAARALTLNVNGAEVSNGRQALNAIAGAASTVFSTGASVNIAGYTIVYDPRTLGEEIAKAFAPGPDTVTFQRGRTADGRTVLTPAVGQFTSGFGPRWGSMHQGIDIANVPGTPILSVMDGTVIAAGPAQGFGNWVVIKHDGGEVSVYGHMRYYNVTTGQRVAAGEQIAQIGNEGFSTGPHLHFEIKPDGATQVDPQAWFAQQGITI